MGDEFLGGFLTSDVDDMRIAFSTTNDEARVLLGMLESIKAARTFEEQLVAVTAMRTEVESVTGGIKKAEGGALAFLTQLLKAEDAGLRLNAATEGTAGAASHAAGNASGLAYTIGTAADEAARLLANLNSVPGALAAMGRSVQGQIESIRAQNSALNYELSEGLSSAAANRRVQLDTMVSTAGTRGQKLNFDQIASEYAAIAELDAASKETDRLRSEISEKNKPAKSAGGSGGGRASDIKDEAAATADLNKALKEKLTSLTEEKLTLEAVAQGTFQTAAANELFAQAMVTGGGAVDAQTMAMIKQIDVAAKLNEELKKAARDPVKEWMDSVPNWLEAGKQIELGAIDSLKTTLSDFIKTGKFDLESSGESILGLVADVVADKAVKELMTLMGRGEQSPTGGFGGMLAGLFSSQGDTPIPGMGADVGMMAGGQQAATMISTGMTTAGQTVAQQISAALTQGGSQAAASVQGGLAAGSNNVRTAAQTGLASGSNNIRIASSTGGAELGRGVVTGAQQGAPILSAAVAGEAGGGGGGMFSFESIAGMLIGAFSEGGMSNSPVGFSSVSPSAFRNAPHFSQGTANTSGIPAMLHDNEAVIPLSKGRKIGVELNGDSAGGGTIINAPQTITINTPDADSFRRSRKQVASDMARAGQAAVRQNT